MTDNKRRGRVKPEPIKPKPHRKPRKSYDMKQVLLRLEPYCKRNLDRLCRVNNRSRPDLLSILIDREAELLKEDPTRRINP